MRRALFLAACCVLACSLARAADAPAPAEPPLRWFPGDTCVFSWPEAKFTIRERAEQAAAGGLTWMVRSVGVDVDTLTHPNAPYSFPKLEAGGPKPILGLRWNRPPPIGEDIICLGVDPDLPLPASQAQAIIDWTNRLGGAAILADPGRKLGRYVRLLQGFAAFEAFSNGKWSPECEMGAAWDQLLARGQALFIVGGSSDRVRPVVGRGAVTTYVLAPTDSEHDVLDAIRRGRVVVAERDAIRLNFTVNGRPPGSTVRARAGAVEVTVDVDARENVDEVHIIGNTRVTDKDDTAQNKTIRLARIRINAPRASHTLTVRLARGTRYLRAVAIRREKLTRTLANPVFIGVEPGGGAPKASPAERTRLVRLLGTAVNSLDWTKPKQATKVLEGLLGDGHTGLYAALALAKTPKDKLDRIPPLLASPHPRARMFAAFALVRIQGADALPALKPLLKDPSGPVQTYAARTLARFAGDDQAELALEAARDPRASIRQYAAAALASTPSTKSLFAIRWLLEDRVETVRRAAANQLCLTLGVSTDHQARFIEAFSKGDVDAKLLEEVVTRADLRDKTLEAARLKITGRGTGASGAPDRQPPAPGFPLLSAAATSVPLKIDGKADEKIWAVAVPVGGFVRADGKPAAQQTTVRALHDRNTLYLHIQCAEPEPKAIVANEKARDGNVWLDDSLDIYLTPTVRRDLPNLLAYRLSVNSIGTRFDEKGRRRHWNAAWQAATLVGEKSWAVELAIPYGAVEAPTPAGGRTRWLINIVRHRRPKPEEDSSFAPGDPRQPAKYATLQFD